MGMLRNICSVQDIVLLSYRHVARQLTKQSICNIYITSNIRNNLLQGKECYIHGFVSPNKRNIK